MRGRERERERERKRKSERESERERERPTNQDRMVKWKGVEPAPRYGTHRPHQDKTKHIAIEQTFTSTQRERKRE